MESWTHPGLWMCSPYLAYLLRWRSN
jgi:hypothetical protein